MAFIALNQITVVCGGRHFERCSMFVWLHLIIEQGAREHAVLVS